MNLSADALAARLLADVKADAPRTRKDLMVGVISRTGEYGVVVKERALEALVAVGGQGLSIQQQIVNARIILIIS